MSETFQRNFYKPSAVCPKCGSNNPTPKYIPPDSTRYFQAFDAYHRAKSYAYLFAESYISELKEPGIDLITPDRVDCLCQCGYQWSEK